MTTSAILEKPRGVQLNPSLTQQVKAELSKVWSSGSEYGQFSPDRTFVSPLNFEGNNRLITAEAQKQIKEGVVPNVSNLCRDLFRAFFRKNSTFTPLEFMQVLRNPIHFKSEEVARFLENPKGSQVLVDDPLMKVVLIHWQPGQTSSKHLHPGGGGVIKVIHGALEEKRYHRLDPDRITSNSIHHRDSLIYIDDNQGYHVVSNPFETPAISIHAYVKGQ